LTEVGVIAPQGLRYARELAELIEACDGPKALPPNSNGLVADVNPAFGEQILDVAQRTRVPHVHHHDQPDDDRSSPAFYVHGRSVGHFELKRYDQAIDWARRAIAAGAGDSFPYTTLAATLALTGHEAEAHEVLQHYLGLPSCERLRTIVGLKEYNARFHQSEQRSVALDSHYRSYEGLRKAEMPEGEAKTN
jgi:hypothetical protein